MRGMCTNCPVDAITVNSGVGCAAGIINGILKILNHLAAVPDLRLLLNLKVHN